MYISLSRYILIYIASACDSYYTRQWEWEFSGECLPLIKLKVYSVTWQADMMRVNRKIIITHFRCHEMEEQRMEENSWQKL